MIYLAINIDPVTPTHGGYGMWTHIEFTSPLGAAQYIADSELEPADWKVMREINITEELKMVKEGN